MLRVRFEIMNKDILQDPDIFVVRDFLSPEECNRLIALSESIGYIDAPINAGSGFVIRKDVRNNDRVIHDDAEYAQRLFSKLLPFVPERYRIFQVVDLNERFRFYRYRVGQKFDWHFDGSYHRDNGESSKLTFMIYLNEGFEGGETSFNLRRHGVIRDDDDVISVVPQTGMALVFRHDVLHTGREVHAGTKYVVRSDIMYRPMPLSSR
jgi:predicted 2-oxoglutarate/Fe(II)-dependent dioxygenase YbiX